jgi:hypothetical protein
MARALSPLRDVKKHEENYRITYWSSVFVSSAARQLQLARIGLDACQRLLAFAFALTVGSLFFGIRAVNARTRHGDSSLLCGQKAPYET